MNTHQQENTAQTPRTRRILGRPGNSLARASLYLAVPGAIFAAAWITAGRALFGAGGSLVPVFAISFGPCLLAVLLVAAYFSFKEVKFQERGKRAGMPWPTALVQASSWALALVFGMLVPDRQGDTTVSAAASIFGADFVGLSAGFGNTTGILTFAFAVATLLMAIADHRRSAAASQGIDEGVREELERQDSMYDFLD